MPNLNLRRWAAWMPGRETPEAWRRWALAGEGGDDAVDSGALVAPPPLREIPPLLRRRAGAMGRAALHVLTRPEMPYEGQPLVLCSRLGEFRRSFELQTEMAREGRVSPQQFSMSVHNAIGGLFMMAEKARAPLTALSAGAEGALAGLQETVVQLADGAQAVWLLYCEEPLPEEYHFFATADEHAAYFAFVLEWGAGEGFQLAPGANPVQNGASRAASSLELLSFLLCPERDSICLSTRGDWTLRRTARAGAGL